MTIAAWLQEAHNQLTAADIGTARLDALILLEDAAGHDRSWLLAHDDEILEPPVVEKLSAQLKRRQKHEPLAYIRQKVAFYGRNFYVTTRVLVPRPESETMIDVLKKLPLPVDDGQHGQFKVRQSSPYAHGLALADVGTGSGALGLTAALELPHIKHVHLMDIDPDCLAVANHNGQRFKIKAQYHPDDLLGRDFGPYDIILANLPYVPDSHTINQAAMNEPKRAIFGGPDGLDLYRRLFAQLQAKPWRPLYILTESLPFQHEALMKIAKTYGFNQTLEDDFIQVFAPS